MFDILKKVLKPIGPSGLEEPVAAAIREEVKDYVDTQQAANDMRSLYYTSTDAPSAGPGNAPAQTEMPVQETQPPAATPMPTKKPLILESMPYPHNGWAKVQDKFQTLRQKNPDVTAWLKIGTQLDEAVVQRDNVYYLRRDWQGKDNSNGALFLDQDTKWSTRPYTMMVYGHNMKSGAMFGNLTDYENYSYYEKHKEIILYTEGVQRNYEIISVFRSQVYKKSDNVFKFYKFFQADTQEEFDDFYNNIKALSQYDTGVTAEFGDRFITLSTCVYHVENGRFVVIAKEAEPGDSYLPLTE